MERRGQIQWRVSLPAEYKMAAEALQKRKPEFVYLNTLALYAIKKYLAEYGLDPETFKRFKKQTEALRQNAPKLYARVLDLINPLKNRGDKMKNIALIPYREVCRIVRNNAAALNPVKIPLVEFYY